MGTHPIFESDFDCLTVLNSVQTMPSVCVKDVDQQVSSRLSPSSSRTPARSRSPSGQTLSRQPPTKSWLPMTPTGSTSDAPPSPDTCTCAETPVLVLSERCTVDPDTEVLLQTTSTSPTETSSERPSRLSKLARSSRSPTSADELLPESDDEIWTESLAPSTSPLLNKLSL